jgi:pimeloyl-ACP methyl ester carboxylesterase
LKKIVNIESTKVWSRLLAARKRVRCIFGHVSERRSRLRARFRWKTAAPAHKSPKTATSGGEATFRESAGRACGPRQGGLVPLRQPCKAARPARKSHWEVSMPRARNGAVEIEYQAFGDPANEAVLLINGLGSQMTRWPEPFCDRLVQRGLHPVRFDNRDTGRSTWCEDQKYSVDDMAADGAAVLDAVGKQQAHIVGVSMGGMIAQVFAANYPARTLSLTSIMSNTGNPDAPPPNVELLNTNRPLDPTDPGFIADAVARAEAIGSPGYPWPPGALAARARAEANRAFNPPGVQRQMAAVRASGDRRPKLATIKARTMVLHGQADPLVPVAGGRDTAANIAGAELRIVPGMGHDLPPALYDIFIDTISRAVERARANATA